jgi:hypothetical protein
LAAAFAALTDALVKVLIVVLMVVLATVLAALFSAVFDAVLTPVLVPDLDPAFAVSLDPGLAAALMAPSAVDRAGRVLVPAARRAVFAVFLADRALFTLLALLLDLMVLLAVRPGVFEDCRAAFVDCVLMLTI